MPRRFDLIVFGAGPAGSAAAVTAARAGLSVALVDKSRFPRDKLCGGGLTGRAIGHYRRIFHNGLPDTPLATRTEIAFHAFGTDLGTDRNVPAIRLGMRQSLDASLVAQALAAGARDFTGETGALDPDTGTLALPSGPITGRVFIAADGVNSRVAAQLFGQAFDRRTIGFALEVERPGADTSRPLRIDFGAAEWGYGWQFPKPDGTTIGVGGVLSRNPDLRGALRHYLQRLGVDASLPVKGQFLPFGDFHRRPGRGRILLAGDAAGLVDPITGEGIGYALQSGALAAETAIEAMKSGRFDTMVDRYIQRLRPIHKSLGQARLLRPIIMRPAFRPTFIHSFRNSKTLRASYLRLLAGELDYGEILLMTARRMPSFLLRSIRTDAKSA